MKIEKDRPGLAAVKSEDTPKTPDQDGTGGTDGETRQEGVLLKPRPKTKKPSMYKVLLMNDD